MKLIHLLCALIISTLTLSVSAAPGCMDNSYHLSRKFDNKAYHHVKCLCPCEKKYKLGVRGKCQECQHYRIPKTFIMVGSPTPLKINRATLDTAIKNKKGVIKKQ